MIHIVSCKPDEIKRSTTSTLDQEESRMQANSQDNCSPSSSSYFEAELAAPDAKFFRELKNPLILQLGTPLFLLHLVTFTSPVSCCTAYNRLSAVFVIHLPSLASSFSRDLARRLRSANLHSCEMHFYRVSEIPIVLCLYHETMANVF